MRLLLGSTDGELDGVLAGVFSVEHVDDGSTMKRVGLGGAGVELAGSVRGELLDRAVSLESEASAVALKRRGRAVLDVKLASLHISEKLLRSLALRENVDHGISDVLNLEVGVTLLEAVHHIVSSDLQSLHTRSALTRQESIESIGGMRRLLVLLGLFASDGSSKSSGSGSEKGESLEEHW